MIISPFVTVLGQPATFSLVESGSFLDDLSERERRLLVGALNFHTLTTPGVDLTVHVYHPYSDYTPRLTDDRTFDGRSRLYARRRGTLVVRGTWQASAGEVVDGRQVALLEGRTRHLMISSDETAAARPEFIPPDDLRGKVLRQMRVAAPLLYDELRDLELLRHARPLRRRVKRMHDRSLFSEDGPFSVARMIPAGPAAAGAPRAVLIGMHWFEMGGAERWAFETVRLVKEAGLVPIVLAGRDSHHEWITRPELDGALLLPMSEITAMSQTAGSEPVLRALLENVDLRGVVVHHTQWLYDRLPFIRQSRPDVPIIDTTHILERRGGGYPVVSAHADAYIDLHHVISPSLAAWMTEVQGIDPASVALAPLAGLTVDLEHAKDFRERIDQSRPFTVAFIGRLARQKAPEVFVEAAARARRVNPDLRFIIHGHGEQRQWVLDLLSAAGLSDVVEHRDGNLPVAQTLADADLLAVTSHNEGLTLTTLEAVSAGVPVISTDVGAQGDVIPAEALAPRNVHRAVRRLADLMVRYSTDESARRRLWESERKAERDLLQLPSANTWFEEMVSAW